MGEGGAPGGEHAGPLTSSQDSTVGPSHCAKGTPLLRASSSSWCLAGRGQQGRRVPTVLAPRRLGCASCWPPPARAPHPRAGAAALCLRRSDSRHRAGAPLHPRGPATRCEHRPSRRRSLLCRDPQPRGLLAQVGPRTASLPRPCGPGFRKGLLGASSPGEGGRWGPPGPGSHFFFSRRSFSAWVPSLAGTRGSCRPSSESVSRTGREEMVCRLDPLLLLPWPGPGLGSRP